MMKMGRGTDEMPYAAVQTNVQAEFPSSLRFTYSPSHLANLKRGFYHL